MPFSLYASTGATTTQLNDENPFTFESAEGLSGMAIARHEQRGPLQHGTTDLGFRLVPRIITINLLFNASTDSALDAHRDTLLAAFKPLDNISTFLSVQRDDGEIRTLTVFAVGDITINLVPTERAAHLHRATLRLRAADPLWRSNSVTQGSATFAAIGQWWLAGGAIAANKVWDHVDYPVQNQTWPPLVGSGDWAIAVVTARDDTSIGDSVIHYTFDDGNQAAMGRQANSSGTVFFAGAVSGQTWPGGSAENYHVAHSGTVLGQSNWWYLNGTAVTLHATIGIGATIVGGFGKWRSSTSGLLPWSPAIRKGLIWREPTQSQIATLAPYMMSTLNGSVSIVNDGDVNVYPYMTLRGPMVSPVIVNRTTGGTIDLTGATLGSNDIWRIDLRDGDKTITNQSGQTMLGSPTAFPSGVADFYLAPHPLATGGTNVVVVIPGSVGSAALFTVEIQNKYMSF